MILTLALLIAQVLPVWQQEAVHADPDRRVLNESRTGTSASFQALPPYALADPGDLDPTFGTDGYVITDVVPVYGEATMHLPDNSILVGDATSVYDFDTQTYRVTFVFIKYLEDGTLDSGFGENGVAEDVFDWSSGGYLTLAVQADGKFIAGSYDISAESLMFRRYLTNGDLDSSFGTGGVLLTSASFSPLHGIAVQPDGKIIAFGRCNCGERIKMYRYFPDGDLDATFGNGGIAEVDLPGVANDEYAAIDLLPDGKILILGNGNESGLIARFNVDGSLDTTFGGTGWIATSFFDLGGDGYYQFKTSVTQTGDKLLVGGSHRASTGHTNFMLARYNSDGSLDTSFGNGGRVLYTTEIQHDSFYGEQAEVQEDGKLLVSAENNFFTLRRYELDGGLDDSFGEGGEVTTGLGKYTDWVVDAVVLPDERILTLNSLGRDGFDDRSISLGKYNVDGSIDTGFGANGFIHITLSSTLHVSHLVRRNNGRLLLAGYKDNGNRDFALVQLLPDGSVDTSYGDNGVVVTDVNPGAHDVINDLMVLDDGKVLVCGVAYSNQQGDNNKIVLARYNEDGTIDSAFAGDGIAIIDEAEVDYYPLHIAVDSEERIVVAGYRVVDTSTSADWMVARFDSDGFLDATFGNGGIAVEEDVIGENRAGYVVGMATNDLDQIVLGGFVGLGIAVLRFNVNGTVDSSFGDGGISTMELGEGFHPAYWSAFEQQHDGSLLMGASNTAYLVGGAIEPGDIKVGRFLADGSPDLGWGEAGLTEIDLGGAESLRALVSQDSDGLTKVVALGAHTPEVSGGYNLQDMDLLLVRFDSDLPVSIQESVDGHQLYLMHPYPNPFSSSTSVGFQLDSPTHAELTVYDVLGRKVAQLLNGDIGAGAHEIQWEPTGLASGVYVVRLITERGVEQRRVTLLR